MNFKDLCQRSSQISFKIFKDPEKYFEISLKNLWRIYIRFYAHEEQFVSFIYECHNSFLYAFS